MHSKEERLHYLDSLRGIAALMVASAHFIERTPLHQVLFFKYVNFGQIGVVAFFILSGMVIPYSLKGKKRPVVDFFVSRFFRLYPAYWFSIFLAVSVFAVLYNINIGLTPIIINMTMFQSIMHTSDLFGVYWTLIIELFFYIMCVFLFLVKSLSNRSVIFVISLCMMIISLILSFMRFYLERKVPVAIPLCLSLMFFGSIWRSVSMGVADSAERRSAIILLASFIMLLIPVSFFAYNKDYGHGENAISYIISYFFGILLTILLTTKLKIRIKIFSFLGTISYSVYLVHQFFLEIFFVKTKMSNEFDVMVFLMYLLVVIILASLSYYLIEKPGVEMGKRLRNQLLQN